MRPAPVIVDGPISNSPLQMTFVEWHQEIQTFATKAPAHSLAHGIRLGGSHRRSQNSYPQVGESLVDFLREDAIPIVNEEAVGMIARQRFPELLQVAAMLSPGPVSLRARSWQGAPGDQTAC